MFIQVVGAGEFGRSRRKEEEDGGGEVTQFLGYLMSVAHEPLLQNAVRAHRSQPMCPRFVV